MLGYATPFFNDQNTFEMLNIDDRLIKEVAPKIKPNALAVLLAIAIHLNKRNGTCFPSIERLMKLTGMGRDAVYNALNVLKSEGLLTVTQTIDKEKKTFGRRLFKVSTRFISIFIAAEDAEPLPENPYTAFPYTADPDTANQEAYLINELEQLNKVELINEGERGENAHAFSVELQPLEDERKNTPHIAPPPPKKESAPTVDDLEAPILEWAHSEQGKPNIYKWYSDVGRTCTRNDVESLITTFCATYSTIGDAGKRLQFMADPLGYFKLRFKVFLKDQPRFERPQAQRHEIGQSSTSSTLPKNLPVFR
jgi:hypothetical protein